MKKFLLGFTLATGIWLAINRGRHTEYSDGTEIMVRPEFKKYLDKKNTGKPLLPFIATDPDYANPYEKRILQELGRQGHGSGL